MIKGHDTRGRAVTVNFDFHRLLAVQRVDVYEGSVVIYDRNDPDISISRKDWLRLKPLLRPDAEIYEGGEAPTNHVETVYDFRAYQARIILASLDALPLGEPSDKDLKETIEGMGFVWVHSRGWIKPRQQPKPEPAKPVQRALF
jgi:hypothetical protein